VKFLIDVNLPPSLRPWLTARGHDANHLVDLGLLTATYTVVWELGKSRQLIVLSKDYDFYDRALVFGPPPQVLHIGVGNCSNENLFKILSSQWTEIEASLNRGARLVALAQHKIEVFP